MSASVTAASATSATSSASPTSTTAPPSSGPQSSPLLFFVALGFGVVFTNLWIIVGVKYCFRYNARNRRTRDENGDPIDLATMPRQHRRRREKKLMTMEEVNERFPITKYKSWVSRRADEGLPTAGGVAGPQSRPGSIKETSIKDVSLSHEPASETEEGAPRSTTAASETPKENTEVVTDTNLPSEQHMHDNETEPHLHETKTMASTLPEHTDEEMDEDEQIQMAVPTEMLANPGDSCAICIDTLEDDDDVRGLTCGHAFHASCVDPWLISRRACCPLCKADYYTPKPRPEGEPREGERLTRHQTDQRLESMPAPPGFALLGGRFGPRGNERINHSSRATHPPRFATWAIFPRRQPVDGRDPRPVQSAQSPAQPHPSWVSRLRPSLPSFGRNRQTDTEVLTGPTPDQLEAAR